LPARTTVTASDQVRAAVASLPSPVFSAAELADALPDVKRELFDQVLLRMLQDGKIQRLKRGFYQRSEDVAADSESDAEPSPVIVTTADSPKIANLIWTTADEVLRGDYKPHEYGSVILPFTVMRRIDCVLAPTKAKVLAAAAKHAKSDIDTAIFFEKATGGLKFWNTSQFDFPTLANDPRGIKKNMLDYMGGFSESIRDIFDYYKVVDLINDLARRDLLLLLVQKFSRVNLHPDIVSNADMGHAFEELIRRFSEQSNETAGEHYTPRDAIRLAVELLFTSDEDPTLSKEQRIVTLYDPTAGTGGMLSVAEEHLVEYNDSIIVRPYGQELNEQTYAICKADMLIKGQDISKIVLGNTLSNDAFPNEKFDYMLSNPPYGVDWKKSKDEVEAEARKLGLKGRFGPGLPRISDGQMLFLLHLISKMHSKESDETSRIAIVMNGSPLFSGGAGSGESEIRRYILENDLLEAIVGLPTEMFYNTGIATYIWILSNRKEPRRVGKVQLLNATEFYGKLRRNLGSKRRELRIGDIKRIAQEYGNFKETECSKILSNESFGYNTIVVERPLCLRFEVTEPLIDSLSSQLMPKQLDHRDSLRNSLIKLVGYRFMSRSEFLKSLKKALGDADLGLKPADYKLIGQTFSERDADAEPCQDAKGNLEPDADLRDTENVPLNEDIDSYLTREVLPYVADAWVDKDKTRKGYEIPFMRFFYNPTSHRSVDEVEKDLRTALDRIAKHFTGKVA
jgi:type I restriction enzyme M protein